MPITERTLKNWRREALKVEEASTKTDPLGSVVLEFVERILRMTQELLDQHLLRK